MDWGAKAAWIYEGTVPDLPKVARYGIRTVYIDPRAENALVVVQVLQRAGITPGAYFAASWQPTMTAIELGAWVSQRLNALLPRSAPEAPPAMLDVEVKGGGTKFAFDFLQAYRAHQPLRPTAYTNAPFQGDYIPYAALRKYGMPFYVQLYHYLDMRPADAARAVLEAARGYSYPGKVLPLYDGAAYTDDQREGCYYTLERMP